jgi:hypothetical protein
MDVKMSFRHNANTQGACNGNSITIFFNISIRGHHQYHVKAKSALKICSLSGILTFEALYRASHGGRTEITGLLDSS